MSRADRPHAALVINDRRDCSGDRRPRRKIGTYHGIFPDSPNGFDDFDLPPQQVIDQIGQLDALRFGLGHEVAFYLLIQVHRQAKHSVGLVELSALAFGEVVVCLHGFTFSYAASAGCLGSRGSRLSPLDGPK